MKKTNQMKKAEKKDCDCFSKTKEAILKKVQLDKSKPKGYKIIESDYEHYSIFPDVRLYAKFIIKSTFEKKDGTTSNPRKEDISIRFSYCPFCGKKFGK